MVMVALAPVLTRSLLQLWVEENQEAVATVVLPAEVAVNLVSDTDSRDATRQREFHKSTMSLLLWRFQCGTQFEGKGILKIRLAYVSTAAGVSRLQRAFEVRRGDEKRVWMAEWRMKKNKVTKRIKAQIRGEKKKPDFEQGVIDGLVEQLEKAKECPPCEYKLYPFRFHDGEENLPDECLAKMPVMPARRWEKVDEDEWERRKEPELEGCISLYPHKYEDVYVVHGFCSKELETKKAKWIRRALGIPSADRLVLEGEQYHRRNLDAEREEREPNVWREQRADALRKQDALRQRAVLALLAPTGRIPFSGLRSRVHQRIQRQHRRSIIQARFHQQQDQQQSAEEDVIGSSAANNLRALQVRALQVQALRLGMDLEEVLEMDIFGLSQWVIRYSN